MIADPVFDEELTRIMIEAVSDARSYGMAVVGPEFLLMALIREGRLDARWSMFLKDEGTHRTTIILEILTAISFAQLMFSAGGISSDSCQEPLLGPRAQDVVRVAKDLAACDDRSEVSDNDLFCSLLYCQTVAVEILNHLGLTLQNWYAFEKASSSP